MERNVSIRASVRHSSPFKALLHGENDINRTPLFTCFYANISLNNPILRGESGARCEGCVSLEKGGGVELRLRDKISIYGGSRADVAPVGISCDY